MKAQDIIGGPDRWARLLGLMTLAGIASGLAGPFGSYPANLFTRLFYWTALFWVGTLLLWPSLAVAIAWGLRHRVSPPFAGFAAVLAGGVPLAALAAAGGHLFWPVHASAMRALEWYFLTLSVALPAAAGAYRFEMGRWREGPGEAEAGAPGSFPAESAAGRGIPDYLLETALCLQMEDHHVRVHGPLRSTLHFAALRDVVRDLGETRGVQVHRSWWVAHHAVAGAEEEGRSATLILTNGLRVPVARSRLPLLRERGWLGPVRGALAEA